MCLVPDGGPGKDGDIGGTQRGLEICYPCTIGPSKVLKHVEGVPIINLGLG